MYIDDREYEIDEHCDAKLVGVACGSNGSGGIPTIRHTTIPVGFKPALTFENQREIVFAWLDSYGVENIYDQLCSGVSIEEFAMKNCASIPVVHDWIDTKFTKEDRKKIDTHAAAAYRFRAESSLLAAGDTPADVAKAKAQAANYKEMAASLDNDRWGRQKQAEPMQSAVTIQIGGSIPGLGHMSGGDGGSASGSGPVIEGAIISGPAQPARVEIENASGEREMVEVPVLSPAKQAMVDNIQRIIDLNKDRLRKGQEPMRMPKGYEEFMPTLEQLQAQDERGAQAAAQPDRTSESDSNVVTEESQVVEPVVAGNEASTSETVSADTSSSSLSARFEGLKKAGVGIGEDDLVEGDQEDTSEASGGSEVSEDWTEGLGV